MIVAIQKGLSHLKSDLAAMGFDMVDYGDYRYPIDAVIYKGVSSSLISSVPSYKNVSVFLVDCTDRSAAEIADMLRKRLYTPLF